MTILALNNEQFLRIGNALDLAGWDSDPRFASNALRLQHKAVLHADLARAVADRPLAELRALFNQHSVLHAVVHGAADVVKHPQARHLATFKTVQQPDFGEVLMAATPGRPSPMGRCPHRALVPTAYRFCAAWACSLMRSTHWRPARS